ncbi:hypothetical protein BJ980_001323 [Nocardioides daedukensis]|uniref:Uncharacterized protein n=1 Tax=Nocardioides daedukensis TaxID=634462 RepID=A0A7Y9S2Q6_9ACTN|nr:hypothetical protein [Nocardioides daedukensis]NYG58400.1 hypothetical protein [Nocardioides daedukensis]
MTLAEMGRPGPGPYSQILSQDPIAVHVRVGRARLTATAHATRTTRFGEQVLVSLSGRLTWVGAHRIEDEASRPEEGAAQPGA